MHLGNEALDQLEQAAWEDLWAAAPPDRRSDLGLWAQRIGPALALGSSGVDGPLFNRVIGVDLDGPPSDARVGAVQDAYRERHIQQYWIHVRPSAGGEETERLLRARGLVRHRRSWWRLTRRREAPEAVSTPYRLVRARPDHGTAIGRLFAHAFDATERVAPVVAAVVDRPGWHVLVALDGDTPVGMGALFVQDRLGCLIFAATHPDHRRRGIQGALMSLRIQTALDLGCEVLTTETGEAMPGEPNPSGNNMLRHGFRVAETVHNYRPPG